MALALEQPVAGRFCVCVCVGGGMRKQVNNLVCRPYGPNRLPCNSLLKPWFISLQVTCSWYSGVRSGLTAEFSEFTAVSFKTQVGSFRPAGRGIRKPRCCTVTTMPHIQAPALMPVATVSSVLR